MKHLNYALKQLCRHCREGSYATQRNRKRMLTLIANELHTMGYRKMQSRSIKPKHIEALVKHWQGKGSLDRDDQKSYGRTPLVGRQGQQAERHRPIQ